MPEAKTYIALGLMSGTSLDGLDIAACRFEIMGEDIHYRIEAAETIKYTDEWKNKLQNATALSPQELLLLDREYGELLGRESTRFIKKFKLQPHLVASHGHTVFHRPGLGITRQIGMGSEIRKQINCPVVYDFRSGDVALGGQGAPLVPIGDKLLFPQYAACVNIGGFANISLCRQGKRIAWDICPANIVMNLIARQRGLDYDRDGALARRGNLNKALLQELNELEFYKLHPPKSLGKEWVESDFQPVITKHSLKAEDLLRSLSEHIAQQIANNLPRVKGPVLITGGGAYNRFLMERIRDLSSFQIANASPLLIEYKEALIFALMGVLRIRNEINILSSVTGAKRNQSGGVIIP